MYKLKRWAFEAIWNCYLDERLWKIFARHSFCMSSAVKVLLIELWELERKFNLTRKKVIAFENLHFQNHPETLFRMPDLSLSCRINVWHANIFNIWQQIVDWSFSVPRYGGEILISMSKSHLLMILLELNVFTSIEYLTMCVRREQWAE